VADAKGLDFGIELDPDLPRSIRTDADRLLQILKNLLSNAFKFTTEGSVKLNISIAAGGWDRENVDLAGADRVISFAVADTGIGIAPDKHRVIFEAFQQVDGSTSRTYGGTGLGLSISRELARLLGTGSRSKRPGLPCGTGRIGTGSPALPAGGRFRHDPS